MGEFWGWEELGSCGIGGRNGRDGRGVYLGKYVIVYTGWWGGGLFLRHGEGFRWEWFYKIGRVNKEMVR